MGQCSGMSPDTATYERSAERDRIAVPVGRADQSL
jgi:hypothetical protein